MELSSKLVMQMMPKVSDVRSIQSTSDCDMCGPGEHRRVNSITDHIYFLHFPLSMPVILLGTLYLFSFCFHHICNFLNTGTDKMAYESKA